MASRITADLNSAGLQHCKLVFKSDLEPSVVEVQHDVMRKRTEQRLSTSLQNSPVGDSNNNGSVERAIRDLGGVARTLRSALEERLGQPIGLTHPLVPWLICQAANVLNSYQVRSNGKTAYKTAIGRDSIIPVCDFGEHVHFRPPKIAVQMPRKLDDTFIPGIWLGQSFRDGANLVGTPDGVFRVGDVRHESPDRRWRAELAAKVVGDGSGNLRICDHRCGRL